MNNSPDTTVIFTAYQSIGAQKYVYFAIIATLYIASVFANAFLLFITIWEPKLHQPMYIFLFNLACLGLIVSTAVWPKVMRNLLSDTRTSSYQACLCQVFIVSVYATGTYSVLTVMTYDRYVFIIDPLRYHAIMRPRKVKQLLLVSNLVPLCSVSAQVCLTSRVPLCSQHIQRFFCDNLSVSKLSCVGSSLYRASSRYGVSMFVLSVVFIASFVLLVHIRIITASVKASADSQRKAVSTCAPHLIVFINFSLSSLFSIIYNQFAFVSEDMHMFLSFQFALFPPLLHPIIYGIKNKDIRKCIVKHIKACLPYATCYVKSKSGKVTKFNTVTGETS